MNPLTLTNAVANCIVAVAVTDLALRVFGNPAHPIHQQPKLMYARKFASSVVICGAVLNVATLSTPSWTEVLLNVGFSINYLWSSYYDRFACPINSNNAAKVPKRSPSSRSSGVGKAKKNPPSGGTGRKRTST